MTGKDLLKYLKQLNKKDLEKVIKIEVESENYSNLYFDYEMNSFNVQDKEILFTYNDKL